MVGAPVRQIVSRHCGNYDVFQAQALHRFGDAIGFIGLKSTRLSCGNSAKSASPSTPLPCNHERSRSLAPAFPAVWALSGLTYGVQFEVRNQGFCGEEDWIGRQPDFDPLGLLRLVQRRINL
jgi:hypothetical protein